MTRIRPQFEVKVTDTAWITSPVSTLLLSYPHSGNTWFRYCIEWLTKEPTSGATRHNPQERMLRMVADNDPMLIRSCPLGAVFEMGVDMSRPAIMHKEHDTPNLALYGPDTRLILLVRNYRECVLRRRCYDRATPLTPTLIDGWKGAYASGIAAYVGKLRTFTRWPGRRLMVYYEELVKDPRPVLSCALDFLGRSADLLPEFIADIEEHRRNCVRLYDNWAVSYTRGRNTPEYHGSQLSAADRRWIDAVTRACDTDVYDTYLARYADGRSQSQLA